MSDLTKAKSKEERLKETIHLLKQILDLGITQSEPAYVEIKNYLNDWIKSDDKHVKEHIIEFVRYGRKATLTLPWKSGKSCEFFLKKPRV
jgi:hypothetical protein